MEHAANLDPDFSWAVVAYGRALLRTGATEASIAQFHRVVQLAPEEDSVHYLLATAYRKLGREQEASKELGPFEALAKTKSNRRMKAVHELIELNGKSQELPTDLEPGFSPTCTPEHP
jgi:Flp pilus assembly protein TadD